nr:MAG TPA: hypothetical protein [Caudoviricetes sp.]
MRILRIFYGYSMIPYPVRHLELSKDKGTKTCVKHRTWWGRGTTNYTNDTNIYLFVIFVLFVVKTKI